MKAQKVILTISVILVILVVAGFITKTIFQHIVESITEREVARITQGEVERIPVFETYARCFSTRTEFLVPQDTRNTKNIVFLCRNKIVVLFLA